MGGIGGVGADGQTINLEADSSQRTADSGQLTADSGQLTADYLPGTISAHTLLFAPSNPGWFSGPVHMRQPKTRSEQIL